MNQVFQTHDGEWQIQIDGEVLPTTWNSKGAAEAGLQVEARRRAVRKAFEHWYWNGHDQTAWGAWLEATRQAEGQG